MEVYFGVRFAKMVRLLDWTCAFLLEQNKMLLYLTYKAIDASTDKQDVASKPRALVCDTSSAVNCGMALVKCFQTILAGHTIL